MINKREKNSSGIEAERKQVTATFFLIRVSREIQINFYYIVKHRPQGVPPKRIPAEILQKCPITGG